MGRLERYLAESRCYHVIARTRGGRPTFEDPVSAGILIQALQHLRSDRLYLLGYVVMPDHVHVILVPRGNETLSRLMQSVKGYSARVVNARRGSSGALWQRSFFDRAIRDERQLTETLGYIEQNPVAKGLSVTAEEYPYSSAHVPNNVDLNLFLSGYG